MKTFTKEDIIVSIKKVGIRQGNAVFLHANLGFLGKLEGESATAQYPAVFTNTILDVIGESGSICVPTFTYSFCNNMPFDPLSTPSNMGILSEYIRTLPQSSRSMDANFSVSVFGKDAVKLTDDVSAYSFGENSFWERYLQLNGKILNINFDAGTTMVHYIEKQCQAPYRYDKGFTGDILINGKWEKRTYYHFVRHLDRPEWDTSMERVNEIMKEEGAIRKAELGRGIVLSYDAEALYDILKKRIMKNPYAITKRGTKE